MFLANSWPTSNEWNVPPFCSHYQNNSTSFPGLLGWRFNFYCTIDVLFHISQNASRVDNSWLWRIMLRIFFPFPSPLNNTMNTVPLCKLHVTVRNNKQSTFDVLQSAGRGPNWLFSKYSLFDDSVSIILSRVVVERFTLDTLGSLAKTQRQAWRANWVWTERLRKTELIGQTEWW